MSLLLTVSGPLLGAFCSAFRQFASIRDEHHGQDELPIIDEHSIPEDTVDSRLSLQLAQLARNLARSARLSVGGAGEGDVVAMQYAFVALVDELLLFSDWSGRDTWQRRPLEVSLFGTRIAGERLVQDIEDLLRLRDPAQRELGLIYLHCLNLGFRGRLRGPGEQAALHRLQGELFGFVFQREPNALRYDDLLELSSRVPVVVQVPKRMFPSGLRVTGTLALGVLLLLLVSHFLWRDVAGRIEPELDRITRNH